PGPVPATSGGPGAGPPARQLAAPAGRSVRRAGQRRYFQLVPTPDRCRARQTRPSSMRLVGEKIALLMDTFAALMMKAMAKRMAATKPSMRAVLPSLLR